MAPAKATELGAAFVDRLAEHLPEGQRAAFKEMMLGAPEAVEELGNGTLRREDFSRSRDGLVTWKQQQDTEMARLRAAAGERDALNTGDTTSTRTTQTVDPNQMPITVQQARVLEEQSISLTGILSTLASRHMHEFNEPFDGEALLAGAVKAGMHVRDYYNTSVAERRKAKADADTAAALAAAEERGKVAGRAEMVQKQGAPPYPVGNGMPTTLMGLRKDAADTSNPYSLDAAVATLVEETNRAAAR